MLNSVLLSTALVAATGAPVPVAAIEVGSPVHHAQGGQVVCEPMQACNLPHPMVVGRDETKTKVEFAPALGVVEPLSGGPVVATGKKEVILGPLVQKGRQCSQNTGGMVASNPPTKRSVDRCQTKDYLVVV